MKRFLRAIKKNWKTTATGALGLIVTSWSVWQNPASIMDPTTQACYISSFGLLVAKDGDKTGVPPETK
jgi:hypothetical protein